MWAIPTDASWLLKKKNQVKSPSPESPIPETGSYPPIGWGRDSGRDSQHPHDDPLVIRVVVANKTAHRVLIDNGSLTDIIFVSTFDKMGIGREKLESVNAYLRGFSGERVLPLGSVQLVLTLGDPPCQAQRRQNSLSWRPHRHITCYWVGLPSIL